MASLPLRLMKALTIKNGLAIIRIGIQTEQMQSVYWFSHIYFHDSNTNPDPDL